MQTGGLNLLSKYKYEALSIDTFLNEIYLILLFLMYFIYLYLATLHSMWDPSSLTMARTCAPCPESTVLNTGLPGKSPLVHTF